MPLNSLRALQEQRLRRLVQVAGREVPFYARLFTDHGLGAGDIRSAQDLSRLPLIDKLDLTLDPGKFEAARFASLDGLTLRSSGTSGLSRTFRHESRSILSALAAGRRQRLVLQRFVKREAGYREAVLNRPGHAGQQIRAFIASRTLTPRSLELHRLYLSPAQPFPDLARQLTGFAPDVIRGIGSHLGAFFRWVFESNTACHRPLAICYGADAMHPSDRQLIQERLQIPVLGTYQAVEALRLGFECEARQGYHFFPDQCLVRVVDAAGRDVAPGERGEAVITNLVNRATPVINYRLGDFVTLAAGPCSCGRSTPRLLSIDGRLDDLIDCPGGTRMPALVLIPTLQAVPGVHQVQVEQLEMGAFLLRVVAHRGLTCDFSALRLPFTNLLGPRTRVDIECVDELQREASGKMRSFISRRKRPC
jgi:phenylacetate-CoA ligase